MWSYNAYKLYKQIDCRFLYTFLLFALNNKKTIDWPGKKQHITTDNITKKRINYIIHPLLRARRLFISIYPCKKKTFSWELALKYIPRKKNLCILNFS